MMQPIVASEREQRQVVRHGDKHKKRKQDKEKAEWG